MYDGAKSAFRAIESRRSRGVVSGRHSSVRTSPDLLAPQTSPGDIDPVGTVGCWLDASREHKDL